MDIFNLLEEKARKEELVDQKMLQQLKHEVIAWREKRFRKEKICIYHNCTNKSIVRSHAIQKSKSLKLIADENHLLQPIYNENNSNVEMRMNKVGINDATTFPGFCIEHEKLFVEFETIGEVKTIHHGKLQSYRNICREIVYNSNELESEKYSINRYKELRNKKATDIANKITNGKKLRYVDIEYKDTYITVKEKSIRYIEDKLLVLKKYHDNLVLVINGKEMDNDIYSEGITINTRLPISLCGIASQGVEDNGVRRKCYCILNVIPAENSTSIIISGLQQDKGVLYPYWKYYTQNNISILNMIESYMVHGSDHWFINPSVWYKISNEKQRIILNEILATEKSFIDQFELSIFDNIRSAFIEQLEEQQTFIYQKNIEDLILHEKRKFQNDNLKVTRTAKDAIFDFYKRLK